MDKADMQARVYSLIDDRIYQAYFEGVRHFKTTDLVLCFEEALDVDPVSVFVRERFFDSVASDMADQLRAKLCKPASEVTGKLGSVDAAFWFVPVFADGEIGYAAIRAKYLAAGGNG